MGESKAKSMGMADWVESYNQIAWSGEYDDLVKRPRRVVAPLVCVEFKEGDRSGSGREGLPIAIPSDTTTGEIRAVLESLPDAADPHAFVVDALGGRYERAREAACKTDTGVGAQLFHNQRCRELVLVEGESWVCSLRMAYSHAPAFASVDSGEDEPVSSLLDRLLDDRMIRTSYFEIPLDALQ